MRLKIIYPVFKIVFAILLLCLFNFQSKADVMLDTTSLEWNQEVNKCVNLLNGAIERNKNIEDSINADAHFNRSYTSFDAEGNLKKSENVVSYQYVIDRNNFNFINEQSKSNLNGKLKALKDNAGISYYILFQPSDYKMTPAEAAIFNSKVYNGSNLGSSALNKGILIIVSVNQTSSSKLYWTYPYYIPTPIIFTTTSTNCTISLSTGAGVNPEVKNEFTNIVNSVFRNTYEGALREQKYLGLFDAVYRKINFSRKVYAYQVDKRGNINEELFTLPATMGNNEAATFSLHVQYPYYEAGHGNDPKYYKQPNPIREEYVKQYARAYVVFCAYSNFSGLYANRYVVEPSIVIYKDAYQNHIDWSLVIDLAGLQASCVGLDFITDFVGAVYSVSQGKWGNAAIYTGAMFLPFISGSIIRIFKIITTDVRAALLRRIDHITKITFEPKGAGYRFSGCHSISAIRELGSNARIEILPRNVNGVYEAKVFATGPDGIEIVKSGRNGISTFFPDIWDEAKILEEVEYAVRNNIGQVPASAGGAPNQFYGFSKDGKVKIEFYYDDATGDINSFFPSLSVY